MDTNKPGGAVPQGSVRNWLIGGLLAVAASIIFGLLYLFVIAPSVPNGSVGWYLFAFATGLTMIVMPCTLPLAFVIVPLSMGKGMIKGISMALAFGLGVAFTLSLYGIAAAVLGNLALTTLGADLESLKNWVYFGAGIFALIFALSEIGLMNFHMPTYSGAAPAFIQKRQEILKAFFLGAFLGNVGVGCPHPATPLILIEIATSGDVLYGWTMFLIHAVGRVLPLLLLAFLAILGVNGLNWLMARKDAVERATGWAMVFVAGFILTLGLFSHKWWVNSGIHSGLESITQESAFNTLMNTTLGTNVAHVHGLETGTGLFGLPLALGSWFLVFLWLTPIWWWYTKRRREMQNSPAFKIVALEAQIDRLERDRRQTESMLNIDELETTFDLKHAQEEIDALEAKRREEEAKIEYGETGIMKNPSARIYEAKILSIQRNYLLVISFFLAVVFIHYLPTTFYLKQFDPNAQSHHAAMPSMTSTSTGMGMGMMHTPFSKSTVGLPDASKPQFVELKSGDSYNITASYVEKEVGNRMMRMLAYNGSIPGPFIKVKEGSQITINFKNDTDTDQTIHSHGLRLNNLYDGVPDVTQDVVKPGATYSYILDFPDAGIAWYHPHTRDDYGQEMGLYGNYLVDSADPEYWSPVNRELPLIIDDILVENGEIATFYKEMVDHALLGRFGNQYLTNGETDYTVSAEKGEVVRLQITNVSNTRTYNLSIPGADMKVVGAEWSRFEQEEFKSEVLISPAERLFIEVYFKNSGTFKLVNKTPTVTSELARFNVSETPVAVSYEKEFNATRRNSEQVDEFSSLRASFGNKQPDKNLLLTLKLTGMVDHSAHAHTATPAGAGTPAVNESMPHSHAPATTPTAVTPTNGTQGIQWDDPTNSDVMNSTMNVSWILRDMATGKEGMQIPLSDWTFTQGQFVKIRLLNDPTAAHVMQHPIHFHGQRFVVLSYNGVLNMNMAWKDTALVLPGEYIDVLVDMSNTGDWMAHCHISEHLHAGMMIGFRVQDTAGNANGDVYRNTRTPVKNSPSPITNSGDRTITKLPLTNPYTDAPVSTDVITTDLTQIKVGVLTNVALSFKDKDGNDIMLDKNKSVALTVTFVSSDGLTRFLTYPGNTVFPAPVVAPAGNVPNTPGFDESKPHTHTFNFIQTAYAHNGVNDGHPYAVSYTIPVQFPVVGAYKGFVEYFIEGETAPRVGTVALTVIKPTMSVDNLGWTPQFKWWFLLLVSFALMLPLSLFVNRYIKSNT